MPVKASVASNWLSLTTAPVPPTTNAHAPNSVQVTVLFVNRTSCAKAVWPSLKANHGASDARLPSSTSPSTTTPRANTVIMSTTSSPRATSPEPGVAQVSVTLSVAIVSSAVTSIVPLTAITSPGRAALSAARSVVSSNAVTGGLPAQPAETGLAVRDGPRFPYGTVRPTTA